MSDAIEWMGGGAAITLLLCCVVFMAKVIWNVFFKNEK